MLKSSIRSKKSSRSNFSEFINLESEIVAHPAWRGNISFTEGTKLLNSQTPFTYILTRGFDKYHYLLSFVDVDGTVKHKNVRVFLKDDERWYINGGGNGGGYESIDNLVPSCLNCSAKICCPL